MTGAVALGSSAWLLGGRDAVLVLLGTIEVSAALVLPEQAETMAVARSATTAIDRLGW